MTAKIPMPIASKIIRGAEVYDCGSNYGVKPRVSLIVKAAVAAVKIDAQCASDMFQSSTSYFDDRSEYPPTRLPFPQLWMEWAVPTDSGLASHHFAVVTSSNPDMWNVSNIDGWEDFASGDVHEVISVMGGGINKNGEIMVAAVDGIVLLDRSGTIIENEKGTPLRVICPVDSDIDFNEIGCALTKPAMLAIGLMNTKNVSIVEMSTSSMTRKYQRRHGIPRFEYHVIQLPGGGTQSDGKGGHRATAIHRVRGHFKTFTAEKPLMGRHVGTYWWGWQVRGNAENGVVVSDYKLAN